jgi:hypothetical protein
VGGLVIAFLAFAIISLVVRTGESGEPEPAPAVSDAAGYGNTVMVASNDEGQASQILFIASEGPAGRSVYVIPPRTVLDIPGSGFQEIGSTLEKGGSDLLMQTMSDLFQLPVDNYAEFDADTLSTAAERAGVINFKSDEALDLGNDITLDAGDNMISSKRTMSYLEAAQDNPQYWPQVQVMFYTGLLEAMAAKTEHERSEAASAIAGKTKGDLGRDQMARLWFDLMDPGQPAVVIMLPVAVSGSGDDWYYEPLPDQIQAMLSGGNLNSSYDLEVRNGTGRAGIAEDAAAKLEPLRYNMTVNAETSEVNYDHTQVRCGSDALDQCNNIQNYLDIGTVIKDELLDKNQIILILGNDYGPEVSEDG